MSLRRFGAIFAAILLIVAGASCTRSDPQASLEAAVQKLQDNLETKKTGAVLDQLGASFRAQRDLDREWAKQTMTLMFLRHQNVRITAPIRSSRIAPEAKNVGYTDAQVLVTGAQGFIPDQAEPYRVKLQWQMVGRDWKLVSLDWE